MLKNYFETIGIFFLSLAIIFLTAFFIFSNDITNDETSTIEPKNILPTKTINKTFKTIAQKTKPATTLIAVGDISFSRGIDSMIKKYNDYNYPLLGAKDYLTSAGIVFANLETSITHGRNILDNEMVFRSDIETAQTLADANISMVSLANNHTPNFGEQGLLDTFKYLGQAGIQYVGAGKNLTEANQAKYVESNGIKFAFLAYNDDDVVPSGYEAGTNRAGTAFMRIKKMQTAVTEAKQNADFVIISMHSGYEYQPEPNDSQIEFAHSAVDAGADLILGHHPHVIQIAEKYQDKWIFYSLGNFIFDQPWSEETTQTLAIKFYFSKDNLDKIEFLPLKIENFCQLNLTNETEGEEIVKRLGINLTKENNFYILEN